MKAQSVHSRRSRSEPVVIPVTIVREGCTKIAENIYELSDHANRFLDVSEDIISRRIAYILVIHAIDEAGKLIEIMRKMVAAERDHESAISVEGFYSHKMKGLEAGTIGLLAIDWLDKIATQLGAAAGAGQPAPFMEYRAHLERLHQDFPYEREHALYVNLAAEKWLTPETPEMSDIAFDAYLLGSLALLVQYGITTGASFADLSDIARQVSSLDAKQLADKSRKKDP